MATAERESKIFSTDVLAILNGTPEQSAKDRLDLLKRLCLAADTCIGLSIGLDLPSAKVSTDLLEVISTHNPAVDFLTPKVDITDIGCWALPLAAEYDSKNRARYPQISSTEFNAHSELAHRYVLRRALGATLGRFDFIDHMCRVHACCNPTHLDFATPAQNNARIGIHNRSVADQPRLF